jgi:hypothetical protein
LGQVYLNAVVLQLEADQRGVNAGENTLFRNGITRICGKFQAATGGFRHNIKSGSGPGKAGEHDLSADGLHSKGALCRWNGWWAGFFLSVGWEKCQQKAAGTQNNSWHRPGQNG